MRPPSGHRGLLAVLGLLVPIEDGSLVEAAPTGWAVVGLLSRVDPLVPDQPLPLAEALATHLASIRLLAGVGAPVHSQVGVPAEALAALAGVGLLPGVRPAMDLQVLPAAEALPAVPTLVGLLPRVAPLVDLQVVSLAEGLPALAAHIGPLPQVGPLVLQEVFSQGEALPTLHTAVGFLLLVRSLVSDQVGAPTEAFPALPALEGLPEGAVGLEVVGERGSTLLWGRKPWQAARRATRLLLRGPTKPRTLESGVPKPLCCQPSKRLFDVFLLGFRLLLLAPEAWRNPTSLRFHILPKAVYLGWGHMPPLLLREGHGHVLEGPQTLGSRREEAGCHLLLSGVHCREACTSRKHWQHLLLEGLRPTSRVLTEVLLLGAGV